LPPTGIIPVLHRDNKGIIKRDIKKNIRQGLRLKGLTRNKVEPRPTA
jgi:hypothetical protein